MIYKIEEYNFEGDTNIQNEININDNLEIGDFILIKSDCDDELSIQKIIGKVAFPSNRILKYQEYICKIDMTTYINKKERETKIKYIEKQLEEKAKNINKYVAFEQLAKYDDEAKTMLEELKQMNNNNLIGE